MTVTLGTPYGIHIAALRLAVGLSQSALARELGVHPAAINHIEAGRVLPRSCKLRALAHALGVDVGEVVPP